MNDVRPACKPQKLNVALLEPYYGGSHAAFVDTLVRHSRHDMRVVTLPARKWKWRMRGASIWFAREDNEWLAGSNGRGHRTFFRSLLRLDHIRRVEDG